MLNSCESFAGRLFTNPTFHTLGSLQMKTFVSCSLFALILVPAFDSSSVCSAQGGGFAGAGAGAAYNAYQNQPNSYRQLSQPNYGELVAVTGAAEISIKPESLRLVFAVTAEGKTSLECSTKTKQSITKIRQQLQRMQIGPDKAVEDFIVVVPLYTWALKKVDDHEHVQEVPKGFRMQTNLHVLCVSEAQAMSVIEAAFQAGVTEIVSFDYFHSQTDLHKREALKKAVEQAKLKAEILLTVFDDKPKVLNISNSIKVSYPESLYKTLTPPVVDQAIIPYKWNNFIKIKAHRPLTTFYAGSRDYSDLSPAKPPMNPEISIVASVTITYGSPARDERIEVDRLKATSERKQ